MKVLNRRIQILREAVVKITQLLADNGVKVTQRGTRAYVQSDRSGRPVLVNIPNIPDDASEDIIIATQGFIDHEVAHILFSDFKLIMRSKQKSKFFGTLHNVVEDTMIERLMERRFQGCGYNLGVTRQFFIDTYTRKSVEEALERGAPEQIVNVFLMPMCRAWAGHDEFVHFMRDYWDHPIIAAVTEMIGEDLIARFKTIETTADSLQLTEDIAERLGKKGGGGGDDESEEKSGGKKGKSKSGKGKSEGKPSKSKKDKSDEPEDEGDEEESKSAKKDKDEESEDEEDEGEGEGGSEDKDEESEDEEDKDGEGSEDDESKDGEGSEDEEDSDDEDQASGGEADEDEESSRLELDLDEIDLPDYDDAVSEKLTDHAVKVARTAEYLVYSTDFDEVKVVEPYDKANVASMEARTRSMVGVMQKDLERIMAQRAQVVWTGGHRRGRVNGAALSRLETGDDRIFKKKQENEAKDVAASILIDCSGSMGGTRIDLATISAFAISATLDRIGIKHEVLGFATLGGYSSYMGGKATEIREEERRIGKSFSRYEALNTSIFKCFHERHTTDVKRRFASQLENKGVPLRNNVDGESVEIAARRLITRPEKRKMLMVLSDGEPCAAGNTSQQARHLLEVVREMHNKYKVECIGIGIQTGSVKRFYPKSVVVNKLEELPGQVMKEIRTLI